MHVLNSLNIYWNKFIRIMVVLSIHVILHAPLPGIL